MLQFPPTFQRLCGTLLLAAALGGCMSQEITDGPAYPEDKKIIAVIDVQVLRDETTVTMSNATARTVPPARAWVNEWWSREFPGLAPGETIKLSLKEFKDRFGDEFRAGGFWATQNPDRLVKFEVEQADGLVGFIVIGQ